MHPQPSTTPLLPLTPIRYADLNGRQKENYNFAKLSAALAEYGYVTMRLSDDRGGADFIAQHIDGKTFLRVQLKSRLCFEEKYRGKDLYIAFGHEGAWYLYPHDELLETVLKETTVGETLSWGERGGYSWNGLSPKLRALLAPYRIPPIDARAEGAATAVRVEEQKR